MSESYEKLSYIMEDNAMSSMMQNGLLLIAIGVVIYNINKINKIPAFLIIGSGMYVIGYSIHYHSLSIKKKKSKKNTTYSMVLVLFVVISSMLLVISNNC